MRITQTDGGDTIFIPKVKTPKVSKPKNVNIDFYMIIPAYEGAPSADTITVKNKRLHLQSFEYNYRKYIPTLFKSKHTAEKLIADLYDENDEPKYIEFNELKLKVVKVKVYG